MLLQQSSQPGPCSCSHRSWQKAAKLMATFLTPSIPPQNSGWVHRTGQGGVPGFEVMRELSELTPRSHRYRKQPSSFRPLFAIPISNGLYEIIPQTASAAVENGNAQPQRNCSCCPTQGAAIPSDNRKQWHSSPQPAVPAGSPFAYELLANDT